MNEMYINMAEVLKPAQKGVADLNHITLTREMLMFPNLRAARNGLHYDIADPGTYARLVIRGQLVMSDTRMERITNARFMKAAHGDVLIAGLGIGMVLPGLFRNPAVKSVTVIEKEQDVIDIVHPQHKHAKLTVIHADVFTFIPERAFDVIWLDIWANRSVDDLPVMGKLTRRYRKWLNKENPKRWIGCWFQPELRALKRRGW